MANGNYSPGVNVLLILTGLRHFRFAALTLGSVAGREPWLTPKRQLHYLVNANGANFITWLTPKGRTSSAVREISKEKAEVTQSA